MASKIKTGDRVFVLSGDDKGKTGTVLAAYPKENLVLVEGINKKYKHKKPTSQNPKGEKIEKEFPFNISNVTLIDPKSGKPTRVSFLIEEGKKYRIYKKSGDKVEEKIYTKEK